MSIFDFLIFAIITGLIFISFFIIISIFGNIFLAVIHKVMEIRKVKNNAIILEKLLLSFGVGILIYTSYCFFLVLIDSYNVFFAYYFIIFIDFLYLFYLIFSHKNQISLQKIKPRINSFINKYSNKDSVIKFIIFLSCLILGLILYIDIITENLSLLSIDPYFWLYKTELAFLNKNIIDIEKIWYPRGFTLINAGFLFPFQNQFINYYFFKIVPIYYLILFFITAYFILIRFFGKKYLILTSFSLILISGNYLSRNLLNLPSSFFSILFSIFFIGILNNYQNFVTGIFLGGIFLIHPISFLFFGVIVFLYFLIRNIKILIFKERKFKLSYGLISLFSTVFFTSIIIIPYILNFSFRALFIAVIDRFEFLTGIEISIPFNSMFKSHFFLFLVIINLDFIDLTAHPFAFYFLTSIIGSIILILKFQKRLRDEYIFVIVSVFFAFVINLSPLILGLIPNLNPQYFYFFTERIFENLTIQFVITISFTIKWILKISRKTYLKLLKNFKINKFYSVKISKIKKCINLTNIIFILILSNIFSLYWNRVNIFYEYKNDEDITEVYLYLRRNGISNSSLLIPENFRKDEVNFLLKDIEVNYYHTYDNKAPPYIFYKDFDYLIIRNNLDHFWKYPNYNNSQKMFSNSNYSLFMKQKDFEIYNGTYNFMNDTVGNRGLNISFIDYQKSGTYTEIQNNKSNHLNVLKCYSERKYGGFTNYFKTPQKNGSIDFWLYLQKGVVYVSLRDKNTTNGPQRIVLRLRKYGWIQCYEGYELKFIEITNVRQWVHFKIKFNGSNNWDFWIDGFKTNNQGYDEFQGNPYSFHEIEFMGFNESIFYIDAINYSWK